MVTSEKKKNICLIWPFKPVPLICVIIIAVLFPFSSNAFDLLLGTGETGSFSHYTGRTICRMINRQAIGVDCKPVPGPDDVHNLTNLRGGSLDIGIIDSRMLHDAINKTGFFEFLDINYQQLRTLVPLYDVPVTLVVRKDAGIHLLEELKGKRINAGGPRSPRHLAVDTILKAKNWSEKDFSLFENLPESQSQDEMALCYGTIQAMVHMGVHPDSSLQQLLRHCKVGLADMNDGEIEKLVEKNPAFFKIRIPENTYPSSPKEVSTFGTRAILVASEDLDEETVYRIMDTLYGNRKRLKRAHPGLSSFAMDSAQMRESGIETHPGAARYFSEHGL